MLTTQAQETLQRRRDIGDASLRSAWGYMPEGEEDREAAAKDAISDILTAVFGPAGKMVTCSDGVGYVPELDLQATANAGGLLDAALLSYFGDAEDYDEA